jgi:hypothetical protein
MSDYLHHVALRMLEELPGDNTMILPGASMVFPLHISHEQDEQGSVEEDPKDNPANIGISEDDQPVNVIRFFEKPELNRQPLADITSSYLQPRLQPADPTHDEQDPEKDINSNVTLPEKELPASLENSDSNFQKTAPHVIAHQHETVRLETEKTHTFHLKEVLTKKEIQQPEEFQQWHILPPEPPQLQKVPSSNKLIIGKITVEIVRPVQPQLKTQERIITRIASSTPKDSDGTNKLRYGLRQF